MRRDDELTQFVTKPGVTQREVDAFVIERLARKVEELERWRRSETFFDIFQTVVFFGGVVLFVLVSK